MEDLLKKIFDQVLMNEKETVKCNKVVDDKVEKVAESYKDKLSEEDLEKLKDDLFSVSLLAEQTGFELGVKFLFQLMNS